MATLGHVEEQADDGFLMTLGPNAVLMIRHAATYVDKILSGTAPGELPVELPTKIDLAVAKAFQFGRAIWDGDTQV